MRYWWGHYTYGNVNIAWCNICNTEICQWLFERPPLAMPKTSRKKIDAHKATHPEAV